ncbi:MAG: hypothetical protein JNL28_06875 [Planctomycetes bacterium]|nr:hypothetical protein [Planctomycetota bacterium]
MKKQNHLNTLNRACRPERILALGAACALALAPVFAFGDVGEVGEPGREKAQSNNGSGPGPGPGIGAGVAVGDEFIGTLPILTGGGQIELHRGLEIFRPSLFIEGNLWEVQNTISILNGTVVANVEPLDPEWTRVRLVFPNPFLLGFDRLAVQGTDIQFGLWIPEPVFYAYPQLSFGSRSLALQPTNSRLALPIAQMSTAGALLGSPLMVETGGFFGSNALLAASNQDFLFLVQRH